MLDNYTIRLSDETVKKVTQIAAHDHVPVRTLMQAAILTMVDNRIGECND